MEPNQGRTPSPLADPDSDSWNLEPEGPMSMLALASPVDQIPNEVLEQVFLSLCHIEFDAADIHSPPVVLVLCRTCTRWCSVAVCVPRLWTKLRVHASRNFSIPPLPVVQTWLGRSGSDNALSLSLVCVRNPSGIADNTETTPGVTDVIKIFLSYRHRWEYISFDFSQNFPEFLLLPPMSDSHLGLKDAPILKRLDISPFPWSGSIRMPSESLLTAIISSAPLLHTFGCHGGKARQLESLHVPWRQLTHLHLKVALDPRSALHVLERTPSLIEAHFLDIRDWLQYEPSSLVTVENLRCLTLATYSGGIDGIFRYLVAPALEVLELSTRSLQMQWNQSDFLAFLDRSACFIITMALRDAFFSRLPFPEARGLLRLSKFLIDLTITSDLQTVDITEELLHALTYSRLAYALCPRLETVTFRCNIAAADGVLSDMIQSRWHSQPYMARSAARLKHIDIELSRDKHAVDVRRLNGFLNEGLGGTVRVKEAS